MVRALDGVDRALVDAMDKLEALVEALSQHDNLGREAELEKAYSDAKMWLDEND